MSVAGVVNAATDMATKQLVTVELQNSILFVAGVFSNIFRAVQVVPWQRLVVVKKICFPVGDIERESAILGKLIGQRNIVQLLYLHENLNRNTMQLERRYIYELFGGSTLSALLASNRETRPQRGLPTIDVALYTWQLYRGLHALGQMNICHRDITPRSLLVDEHRGVLKICSFTWAAEIGHSTQPPPDRGPHYYRPPEVLFGSTDYGHESDLWSGACVFVETLTGDALLPGRDPADQMEKIVAAIGKPTEADWLAMNIPGNLLQDFKRQVQAMSPRSEDGLREKLRRNQAQTPYAFDLAQCLLDFQPKDRLSSAAVLSHAFFFPLWTRDQLRDNGQRVDSVVSFADLQAAIEGQSAQTGTASGGGGEGAASATTGRERGRDLERLVRQLCTELEQQNEQRNVLQTTVQRQEEELQRQKEQLQRQRCSICLDAPVTVVFQCGHVTCAACSNLGRPVPLIFCHVCRQPITRRQPLYLS